KVCFLSAVQIYKPYSIGALKSLGVIYISCGYEHTAVLTQAVDQVPQATQLTRRSQQRTLTSPAYSLQKHTRSTSVCMKILPEINRINQSLVEKWTAAKRKNEEAKRDTGEKNFIDVDLKMARNVFKKLTAVKWISSLITTCLEDNLLRALPYKSSHQDALLIFLLLPECPMMQDPKNWKTLTVEFAKAIPKMKKESLEFLKKCWTSLEVSSLNILVQMLKEAIITISQLRNPANRQLPESTFIINELSAFLDINREISILFCQHYNLLPSEWPDPIVFSDFLFIFDLPSKIKLMHCKSSVKLMVRRSHLVEDTMRQLRQADYSDLRKPLTVEFIKEIRAESFGVSSEFFHCIFEEMTDPKYGMFVYPEKSSSMWFPVHRKFEEEKKKSYFLFGILCGLSLSNLKAVNLPFPLALYKKLLKQKPSLEDLKELSFPLGKSLQEVLNYEAGDVEELHLHFSIHWDQEDVELISNGISVPVNQTNKKDYVSKCVDYIFNTSIKMIYEEFDRGFYTVCNWDIIRQFQPEELMTAIIGNASCDWKQFENNSKYEKEYHKSHPTILLFWKAFHGLTLDEKKKFLLFLTGSDRLHVKDLQHNGIIFRCPQTFTEKDNPKSLTCHNILDLPKYSTMKRMKEALQVAINNNKGFTSWG
ncbi:hypothetical protein A6R68_21856, partial [Neotoma lepida]